MTKDEIIALAKEAGFSKAPASPAMLVCSPNNIERFTNAIQAKWCERCAKVIEEELYPRPRSGYQIQYNAGIQELANKIRSLE